MSSADVTLGTLFHKAKKRGDDGRSYVNDKVGQSFKELEDERMFEEAPGDTAGDADLLNGMVDAGDIDPSKIPPREPILGTRYYKKYVTETIAEAGGSKSTLIMMEAMAINSGKSLTGLEVIKRGKSLLLNLEDPIDELERKNAAIAQHFELSAEEKSGLVLWSGYGKNFHFVSSDGKSGYAENQNLIDKIIGYLSANHINWLGIDPMVKAHGLSENDNGAMDRLMIVLSRIAEQAHCAVSVVHHIRKPSNSNTETHGSQHEGRGASSVAAAARVVHTLGVMSKKAAKDRGILESDRKWYVRLDQAKSNMSPPSAREDWFRRVSVKLPQGDDVGVLEHITLDKVESDGAHTAEILAALHDLPMDDNTISLNQAVKSLQEMGLTGFGGGSGPTSVRRAVETIFNLRGGKVRKPDAKDVIELRVNDRGHKCLHRETVLN